VLIALDWKSELAADGAQFRQRNVAKFRAAEPEIAEPEGKLVVGVEFSQEPGAMSVGCEKLDDGFEVERALIVVDGRRVGNGRWRGVGRVVLE
jgi:hypothetical protein